MVVELCSFWFRFISLEVLLLLLLLFALFEATISFFLFKLFWLHSRTLPAISSEPSFLILFFFLFTWGALAEKHEPQGIQNILKADKSWFPNFMCLFLCCFLSPISSVWYFFLDLFSSLVGCVLFNEEIYLTWLWDGESWFWWFWYWPQLFQGESLM